MNLVNTRKAIYLYCLVVILLTIGCSYPAVTVVIDKKDLSNGKITIDDTMHCLFSDSLIRVQLIPGRHIIRYGNNEQKDFFVRTNGGLLNLDNQEYVAYEVEYQDKQSKISFSMNAITGKATILIDSFIISQKTGISFTSDSMLNTIVPILLKSKNGNYLFQIKNNENGYDTSESVFGLKKFGKDQFYIDKFWDYDHFEELPESITVKTLKSPYHIGKEYSNKIAIMPSELFLIMAKMNPGLYTVRHISEIEKSSKLKPIVDKKK